MKNMSFAQKMRWIAGCFYVLLFGFQTYTMTYALSHQEMALAYLPVSWLFAVALIPAAGAMALWMFAGKGGIGGSGRRMAVMGTVLVVLFELLTYESQAEAINAAFYFTAESLYNSTMWKFVFMLIRLLLLIFGAFFITCSREGLDGGKNAEAGEAGADGADAADEAGEEEAEDALVRAEEDAEKANDSTTDNEIAADVLEAFEELEAVEGGSPDAAGAEEEK